MTRKPPRRRRPNRRQIPRAEFDCRTVATRRRAHRRERMLRDKRTHFCQEKLMPRGARGQPPQIPREIMNEMGALGLGSTSTAMACAG